MTRAPRENSVSFEDTHRDETEVLGEDRTLESLSYSPLRFDLGATFDVERSHARYSRVTMQNTRR
eukprot:CAMPEP_0194505540 /NCGR_PEP_ID=MMETSP0253-20130528/32461_1 /TAXON_ID=2966 /ORGANISM="Noctiluca scintillans" /LENGTH=64 /DNA_ID=CAMNT_0039348113 /DNA_START=87 /DNA_END=281 /DNA_ORIENTATION=-